MTLQLSLLSLAFLMASCQQHNVCTRPWPDVCPQTGVGPEGCTPYAPPPPTPTDWLDVRARLINELFGVSDGLLPTAGPDYILPVPGNTSRGCWCSTLGNCDASTCQWASNQTLLIHTITVPVNASFTLQLNSTVSWTLNTSGVAPVNYAPLSPVFPDFPLPPTRRSDTLVIYHQGHDQPPCLQPDQGLGDFDGSIDYLNQLGYDVANLDMPTYQSNAFNSYNATCDHAFFAQFAAQGAPWLRAFLEPVVRTVNYALQALGYQRVAMVGLSGGGWTTTMLAAIDPRIALSIPIAGSMPCDFQHTSWDFEQLCSQPWAQIANYSSLYVLGALEAGRTQVQLLHEQDSCCFHGCGRHDRIRGYNALVQGQAAGAFATAVTQGNAHEVNLRDKVILGGLLEQLRVKGALTRADIAALPFDTMREW